MNSGVYCIHCIPTGKKYIGGSTDIQHRLISHRYKSKSSNSEFYADVRKYGWDQFIIGVVEPIEDIDIINVREPYWINTLNTINEGYNTLINKPLPTTYQRKRLSDSLIGRELSDETKNKISEGMKGNTSFRGRTHTQQTKDKIRSKLRVVRSLSCVRKKYLIEDGRENRLIEVSNLKDWCIVNEVSYNSILNTLRTNGWTKKRYRIQS